jgi:hypothetical protein
MNNILLSGGIIGIDWSESINMLVRANSNISHSDNFMLKTKGEYDELVLESSDIDRTDKKLKGLFKCYLSEQIKELKSPVNFLSDLIFLDSGATWQTLNSDKTFAFFFCSPEYYLAKIEDATGDGEKIDQQECLDNWLEGARKIWEFYVCYPDSTLLINIEDVAKDPLSTASKVFEFLGCELDDIDNNQGPNSVDTAMLNPIEKLSLLLIQNMKLETIKASSELNEQYENLAMTSILADSALSYDASERASLRLSECQKLITVISTSQVQLESDSATLAASNSELIEDNAKLKAEFATRTPALETSLSEFTTENELALLQIKQLQDELSESATLTSSNSVLIIDNEKLKAEFATRSSAIETSYSELTAENELALLQINQLQEEFEATYLNGEKVKGELAVGATSLETQLTKLKAENELAAVQINQLEKELETTYSNAKELMGESATCTAALETSFSELTAENELALLQINQLQEKLAVGSKSLETSLFELTAENELSLLQINQLQEELEHYYTQYQKMTYSPNRKISYATDLKRVKVSLSLMNMN